MDTSVPGIEFDIRGECNYCKLHDRFEERYPLTAEGQKELNQIIRKIKKNGRSRKYDCILGLSGGRDSCYMLSWAVKKGLRPLAVFYDSGWYSNQSKGNIRKITKKLSVDVEIVTCDPEEYKDIQIAFLKGSTNDIDAPDDQAIIAVLLRAAANYNIKYILSGHSFRTEGNTPVTWSYMDGRYVKDVHRRFGRKEMKTYPLLTFRELVYNIVFRRIKYVYPLEYVYYDKLEVSEFLKKEFDWIYSGGHHFDCQYIHLITKILREKFNIDKRKVEYSALIRSGQMNREDAISVIESYPVPESTDEVNYSIERLNISKNELDKIMNLPPKTFLNYRTYFRLINRLGFFIGIACKLRFLPMSFYEKYVKMAKALKS
ncbi:MAG: N-acetyl sugar amidotransferase [Bacteroidales bacterium]|nr:N-acetyl sugar amidotransferase [Bacteroidales bacterium]